MKARDRLQALTERLEVPEEEARRLEAYLALLEKWSARINLTASVQWDALGPLFHEALWAAGFHGGAGRHLDIGSGAGFPAIPLAVMRPAAEFELVESRSRRAVFLEVVARELALGGVRVIDRRLEEHLASGPAAAGWDCVSWKAVRMARRDVASLAARAPAADYWLFHARDLPVADAGDWSRRFDLRRREAFPGGRGWSLSMFHVKRS